jgi:Domain of unknown function (DUF4157)/Protein of unknown function (DUF2778)
MIDVFETALSPAAPVASRAPVGLQRHAVDAALPGSGRPLDAATRPRMERAFQTDFSRVRVHDDSHSAATARALDARAFTVGRHIVFGAGQARTPDGMRLLAHELAHVAQQSRGEEMSSAGGFELLDDREDHLAESEAATLSARALIGMPAAPVRRVRTPALQRATLGTAVTHPRGSRSTFRRISATFDGREFVVSGDGTEVMRVSAQSGRPLTVRPAEVAACGGTAGESYLNNPRYVGIRDNGPIPEGEYQFRATQMATFTGAEQSQMILGGHFTDPFGASIHGGDWGAGRVALNPIRVLPGRRGCGNTAVRSGFFLHGGVMPGSSGCIDIGDSAFTTLVSTLMGYRDRVVVTVRYRFPAPTVGAGQRALGRFMYPPTQGGQDPSLGQRIWNVLSGD